MFVKPMYVLDGQQKDLPDFVKKAMKAAWKTLELGNDTHYFSADVWHDWHTDEDEWNTTSNEDKALYKQAWEWLVANTPEGVKPEHVKLHYWW